MELFITCGDSFIITLQFVFDQVGNTFTQSEVLLQNQKTIVYHLPISMKDKSFDVTSSFPGKQSQPEENKMEPKRKRVRRIVEEEEESQEETPSPIDVDNIPDSLEQTESDQEDDFIAPEDSEYFSSSSSSSEDTQFEDDDDNDHECKHDIIDQEPKNHSEVDKILDEKHPFDFLRWIDLPQRNKKGCAEQYLDKHGKPFNLSRKRDEKKLCYIVTPTGEVISSKESQCIITEYYEDNSIASHAPGFPCGFEISESSPIYARVRYRWLMTDKEFKKAYPSAPSLNLVTNWQSHLLSTWEPNTDPFGFDYAKTRLSNLTTSTASKWMPKYANVIALYHRIESNKKDIFEHSLHNYLLFYHVRQDWLWRTVMGQYIYKNYFDRLVEFGGKRRDQMMEDLLHTTIFGKDELGERGNCDACGKTERIQWLVTLSKQIQYSVGCNCLDRMKYVYKIGKAIHQFRDSSTFDMARGTQLFQDLVYAKHKFLGIENKR
jgi:hypothetical protein